MKAFAVSLFAGALCLALAGAARAEDKPEKPKSDRAARQKELLEKYDKDGDGKLSDTEREAARAAGEGRPKSPTGPGGLTKEEFLKKYDTNGDGQINDEERKAAHEDIMKQMIENPPPFILERFDADKDGKLTGDEIEKFKAAAKERAANREKGGEGKGPDGKGPDGKRPEGKRPEGRGPGGPDGKGPPPGGRPGKPK